MRKTYLLLFYLVVLFCLPVEVIAQGLDRYSWQTKDKITSNELAVIEEASGKTVQQFLSNASKFAVLGNTILVLSHEGILYAFNCGPDEKPDQNRIDTEKYNSAQKELGEKITYFLNVKSIEYRLNTTVEEEELSKADKLAEEICNIIAELPLNDIGERIASARFYIEILAKRGNRYRALWEPLLYNKFPLGSDQAWAIQFAFNSYLLSNQARPEDQPTINEIKWSVSLALQKLSSIGLNSSPSLITGELIDKIKKMDPAYAEYLKSLL